MGTIADKLSYLNTTKGKIKDSINLTGANIGNNDTFRSYSAKLRDSLVDIINNGTDELYDNFPKVTGTGSEIELSNTYEAPMGINLKGNTHQDSYSGKNLLNPSTLTTGTINGITCSYDDTTKIITFNGTCTTDNTIFDFSSTTILFQANKTKQIIYYESGTLTNYGQFRSFNSSYGAGIIMDMTQLSSSNNKMMMSNTVDVEKTRFSFRFNNGSVANNFKVKVMITNDDNTDFEPYVGGTASPNPDYPQDVEVVTGDNTISVCGKNLLNNTSSSDTKNGVTFTKYSDGTVLVNGTATNGTFFNVINDNELPISSTGLIMSGCPSGGAYGTYKLRTTYTDDGFSQDYGEGRELTEGKTIKVITIVISSGTVCNNLLFKPMISTTGGEYEPYQSQAYEINLGKNLLDISAVTSTSYITNNGDGSITLNGVGTGGISFSLSKPFTLKANITYIMSLTNTNSNYAGSTFILRNGNTNILQQQFSNKLISYKPTNDVIIDTIRIYAPNTITFDNFTFSIQLEQGSTATSYSPYFTPIELCKIGTYQDYIYKSSDKWYKHSEIYKHTFDGTESNGTTSNNILFYFDVDSELVVPSSNAEISKILSNIYLAANYNNAYGGAAKGVAFRSDFNNRIYVSLGNYTKTQLITLLTNFAKFYCVLATPTDTEITDTTLKGQLEAIYNAYSYNNQTNISQENAEQPFILNVSALLREE